MKDSSDDEANAFFDFFATFNLSRPTTSVVDLSDGLALFDVLSAVDENYFRVLSRPAVQLSDNWVIRFAALKRLYRLITQYFAEVLHQPSSSLDVPDLQAMAKDFQLEATLVLCRLTICIAVQTEKNKEVIDRIQVLSEPKQHVLMRAIEQVMSKFETQENHDRTSNVAMTEDDHFYRIHSDRSRILVEKETLQKAYEQLWQDHRALQSSHDDMVHEKDELSSQLRDSRRRSTSDYRSDKTDALMRTEIDRLRLELQKSEENLNSTEAELEKNTHLVTELTRKIDELQIKADQTGRLKDQVDEYKHAAEKLQKTENVMEKYKKKLEESADLRRNIKSLEEQNAMLVDKNAALEEEYRKVAAFRPLMESYKAQTADLETKVSARLKDIEALKFELEQSKVQLRVAAEERAKDSEALELYQERVRELELTSTRRPGAKSMSALERKESTETDGEPLAFEVDASEDHGLGEELDDALSKRTMTDLKLEIRQLKRDLDAAQTNQVNSSRILVLENLLEDANRMKTRYETDYLTAHKEKLVLQRDLEEIREGKSLGDGAEAAIALRQRLNETVETLDDLKKEHAELQVRFEAQSKDLTIAKSDLNLVNKDQLEILATLRDSVSEDKLGLESEMEKFKNQIRDLKDKNRMQLEQVNALLMEKISLQSEGIGQREKMLERERDYGNLKASLNGRNLSEEDKRQMLAMHEKNVRLEEEARTVKEQLAKARVFIKNQDKLFREREEANKNRFLDAADANFQLQDKEEKITQLKRQMLENQRRYGKEQQIMLSVIHAHGLQTARTHLGDPPSRPKPTAWLLQQRQMQVLGI